nr:hypothetical protein [Kitasatospora aureofaciens]
MIERKLKKIQYRLHLINGRLPPTGLAMDKPHNRTTGHHEFNLSIERVNLFRKGVVPLED